MNVLDSAPIEQIQWNRKGNVMQCVQERERETERERMFVCVCVCVRCVRDVSKRTNWIKFERLSIRLQGA